MLFAVILALTLSPQHGGGHAAPPPAPPARVPAPAPRPPGFNLPHDVPPRAPAGHAPGPVGRPVQPLPRPPVRPPARGPQIVNPHHWGAPWQWNNGVAWVPAPAFWGGGFWGPWGFGLGLGAYYAYPDTPGYDLLQQYGLTQTPCGQPNLVEIFGPDGSEICAYPNALVGPGQYDVDPTTLTLISY
jgi:hypothetical protein